MIDKSQKRFRTQWWRGESPQCCQYTRNCG